ncbi:MAG: MFS transporter, partial [Ktedonobacterales bacterium]
ANISIRTSQLVGWPAIRRIDFLGAALACAATICLLLGLTWGGQTYPWESAQVIGALVAAGALFAAFVLAERFTAEPILPLALFGNRVFASAALLSLTIGAILLSLVIYLPLYLQGVLGVQATYSGNLITPLTISLVLGAASSGIAVSRTGRYQWVTILGGALLCIGVFLLTQVDRSDPNLLFVMGRDMVITGIGLGSFLSILTLAVQNALPRTRLGVGTSAIRYMQATGQTLGVALIGTVVNNVVTAQLNTSLPKIANIGYLNSAVRSVATNQQILVNQQYHDGVYARVTHEAVAHGVPAIVKATAPGIIKQQVAAQSAHIPPGPGHAQAVAQLTQQITTKVTQQVTAQATHEVTQTTVTLLNNVIHALRDALAVGVIQGLWVTLIIAGVTLALTLLLKDVPLAKTFREGAN